MSGNYLLGFNSKPFGLSFGGAGGAVDSLGAAEALDILTTTVPLLVAERPQVVVPFIQMHRVSKISPGLSTPQYNFFIITLQIDESIPRKTFVWSLTAGPGKAVGITHLQTYTPR